MSYTAFVDSLDNEPGQPNEPKCDLCGQPEGEGEADWNGETGNHESCEIAAEMAADTLANHEVMEGRNATAIGGVVVMDEPKIDWSTAPNSPKRRASVRQAMSARRNSTAW